MDKGKPIYYLCHKDHAQDVPDRLKELATKPPRAKEYVGLCDHYKETKYPVHATGWIDCSNGFMFFVDKVMFDKTCALFEVKVQP